MMNIKLRTDVLSKSLIIENALSEILAIVFNFKKNDSRTLGHKGNPLSFKAKAEMLDDLKLLKDQEYKDLIMFMEIRNQLIHNLETDTLAKAAQRCDKTNKLLACSIDLQKKPNPINSELTEDNLKEGLKQLYVRILHFLRKILEEIVQDLKNEEKFQIELTQTEFLVDIVGLLKKSIYSLNEISTNYPIQRLKEIETTILFSFWEQIQKKYPEVFKIIEIRVKLKQKKH
jgi:hypothetical protein